MPANTPRGYTYPLYGDTQNFPAQIQDLATDIDTDVDGLYDARAAALYAPTGVASFTGALALASGVTTTVTFDTELYDNANMVDIAGAPTDISIPSVGNYLISASVRYSTGAAGSCALLVISPGGFVNDVVSVTKLTNTAFPTSISAVALTRCTSTVENIRVQVRQLTGGAMTVTSVRLQVTKVAP